MNGLIETCLEIKTFTHFWLFVKYFFSFMHLNWSKFTFANSFVTCYIPQVQRFSTNLRRVYSRRDHWA
jgi:hypothetical protein